MFSGLWAKLVGIMGAALAFMALMLKLKNHEIENLEEENIMHQKKGHITEQMNKVKKEEEKKSDEAIKDINTDNWRDRL